MYHSQREILKVANTLSHKLIALEAAVIKEMGNDDGDDGVCEALKYQLADLVALARMVTADLGDNPFGDDEK